MNYNIIVVGNFTNDSYILSQKMRKNKRKGGKICMNGENKLSHREVTLLAIFRELDEFDKGRICAFAETLYSEVELIRLTRTVKKDE